MEEVRQLVQEEGREARNLVAFHVAVDNPVGRLPRKPPRAGLPPPRRAVPRTPARLRSASAGRDKRSELRARYWALLFGDLQRAVGELYNTVEAHESPNECQEVILVLENYTRDFKALCEWFRLKWEYESTPPPQRPQSLAWEIRKTDFVRPESRRTHSVKSSPSVSGKNSPCLSGHNSPSGKNSPNLAGKASPGSGKISPRLSGHVTSPKGSIEFFSSKITTKIATKPEPKLGKETRLSDIKEKDVKEVMEEATNIEPKVAAKEINAGDVAEQKAPSKPIVEVGKAKECLNVVPMQVNVKSPKRINDSKLMNGDVSNQSKATIEKLDAMESEFLAKNFTESTAKNDNLLNQSLEHDKNYNTNEVAIEVSVTVTEETADQNAVSVESPSNSEDNFADISNESSKCDEKVPDINRDEIIAREVTKAKSADVTTKTIGTQDVNGEESLKYKETMTQITKHSIDNVQLEEIVKDIKPTEELKDETKDKTKTEPQINDKGPKSQRIRKVPKGLKKLENKSIFKKEDTKVTETTKKESEPIKKDEQKKLETKPIFQLKSSSRHEYTPLTIEDIDIKKDEIKKLETKPIFDVKAPTRPAFNQATIDLNKKEDIKKVDPKPTSDLKLTTRPAYSQAAAKPKLVTAKAEVKIQTKALARSKTVVEIRPSTSRTANRNQKSKCSYPFNLTTGRSSLFDGGANKATNKKPVIKPLSAGDRSQFKIDTKRPPRPMSLKLNEKGDKEESNNLTDINKDLDEYSSSETIVTQIDITRMESSESLKTIVPENEHDVASSIEVLNVEGTKNDNEGWLTVKSRRLSRESKKSKSHWANRFNQPSATTSLPTLNMLESPKSETNPITTSQLDRAKSEQPQTEAKPVKVAEQVPEKTKDTSMIRQKSDVTGLKTKSSRNKAIKKDKKIKDSEEKLTKNRLHSSLESLTNGLARSQESTADAFDFDKWRAEFKSTFKYLEEDDQNQDDTEILKTADPSEMSEIAEMTSQIEENERKISLALDFQTEADQRKLCEEEDLLNRQIMELQQVSDIDLDTETDDTETDAEILCEDSALESCQSSDTLSSLSSRLEDQYEGALAGMSWAERVDTLGVLEELVARDPGRAQQLHAKLSQGIKRRGSLQDALRRLQAKQARAERQRTHFHTERAKKIHQLLARVEEVKVAKNQLIDEKRIRMERRLQKAAENRNQHIKDIVRKAHDEEEKLREIAFIKQLEAENRRHEFLEQCRSHTTRLREMRRERLDKLEQKTAREAAVGARKKALDEARKLHVEGLLEKRKQRDARVERRKERRKQERDVAAKEKAEGLKSRLSAIAAAAELEADALRSRIRDKQDASQQRLESHLQAIREKATTGPRQATTSESQEAEKKEEAAKLERQKKEKERQKNIRKKARKFKQRLLLGTKPASEMLDSLPMSSRSIKLHKLTSQLNHLLKGFSEADGLCAPVAEPKKEDTENNNVEEKKPPKKKNKKRARVRQSSACESVGSSIPEPSAPAPAPPAVDNAALERVLGEIHRIVYTKENQRTIMRADKTLFTRVFTVKTCGLILTCAAERDDLAGQLSTKVLNTCVRIIFTIASLCARVGTTWLLYTPALVHCVTLLGKQIMEKDMQNDTLEDEFTKNLAFGISLALNVVQETSITKGKCEEAEKWSRVHNLVSYICLSGIVSHPERCGDSRKTVQTLLNVIGDVLLPVYEDEGPERIQAQQNLRSALNRDIFHMRNELCLLFAEGAELAQNDVFVNAARIVHTLRALGEVDYRIVQEGFGEDGWPLEFRAAISRLLNQHAPSDKEAPRKEPLRPGVIRLDAKVSNTFVMDLIELIGYVTVNNAPLRNTICGNWSVIKTLCNLPANWLVSRPHMHKLLPTLLVLAQHLPTMDIVVGEISLQTLAEYLESEAAQQVKLVQLLRQELRTKIKKEAKDKAKANAQPDAIADTETNTDIGDEADIKTEANIVTEAVKSTDDQTD